jgi:hypothetical protein
MKCTDCVYNGLIYTIRRVKILILRVWLRSILDVKRYAKSVKSQWVKNVIIRDYFLGKDLFVFRY